MAKTQRTYALGRDRGSVQQQLRELTYALDQASIVARTDVAGKITYINDKFCEISGYSREELLGQDHRIVNSGHHPRAFMTELWRTIGAGRIWRGEVCNRAKNGRLYWVDTTIVPLLDDDGKTVEYIAIRTDITDRKEAERKLRDKQSLVKLGEMASVVAHEVRNPLAGIMGALQVLSSRSDPASTERSIMDDIVQRVRDLNETLDELLAFARPQTADTTATDLPDLLADAARRFAADPRFSHVDIVMDLQPCVCVGDPKLLMGVLLNLCLNAAHVSSDGGVVEISCGPVEGGCEIRVADNGPGIAEGMLDQIWQPFFTTKAQGTGLGLPTVRNWVLSQGGEITLENRPAGGVQVQIWMPAAQLGNIPHFAG